MSSKHDELARQTLAAVRVRRPTVWDARRLLASCFGRWAEFEVDDGQFAGVACEGVLRNVVHHPDAGFTLVLDHARPLAARARTVARRMRIPVHLVRRLPDCAAFLAQPTSEWPVPPAFVICDRCGQDFITGRFCHTCRNVVRRGRWLGPGFSEMQRILRDRTDSRPCGCGGVSLGEWRYCTKCGHENA